MNNQLILVADSDPKNLQILKENLEASGFQVITVADGIKAWEEIQRNAPKIILTEITLPELTGFQLLEKLQADPNTSFIPLIFLTNQREVQQRVRSFQMGAKDYLIKPLHVKEVIAHIRMVLRRMEKRQLNPSNGQTKFSGRLDELNLADLIESFSVERKTGILTLTNGNNRTGQIYFRDGNVINASLGDINLENAIYEMLSWNSGFFNMVFSEVDVPDEISISNLGLLLEGVKRMERTEKLLKKFPSPDTSFTITPTFQKIIEKKKLAEDVQKFISLIDGKRSVTDIIQESCYDELKTIERLLRLYQQGFIKPSTPYKVVEHRVIKEEPQKPEPEREEKVTEKEKLLTKPPKIEFPTTPIEKETVLPDTHDEQKPIQQRIEKHRTEIIFPPDIESIVEEEEEISPKEEIAESVSPADEVESSIKSTVEKLPSPSFNQEEFLKKKKQLGINKDRAEKTDVETPEEKAKILQPHTRLRYTDKNQLLVVGFDEDSLDEVMEILTSNDFQTKNLELFGDFPIHFGKITFEEYNFISLLGILVDKSLNKIIEALSKKLIGIIFIIDCTRSDVWEYANYLLHLIGDNFELPHVVTVTNFHEQNSITMEVIRYKLNLDEQTIINAWDAVDKASIKKLLFSVINPQKREDKKPADMLEELVEKITA